MSLQQTDRYDDMHNRAAQFMPFAALTGYDDIIKQTSAHSSEAVERANAPVNLTEGYLPA